MTEDRNAVSWPRRLVEAGFFVLAIGLLWTLDTLAKINVRNFEGQGLDDFRLIAEQATSAVVVLLLVPGVAWWLRRFPLERERIASAVVGHIVGSGLFATTHYFGMVALRRMLYPLFDRHFVFSDFWFRNLVLEYQKDVKIYIAIVAIVAVYGLYRRQAADKVDAAPDRLIVQTGSGEAIVRIGDIECLEAARNYVVVGTASREYLVRDTLSHLEATLAPGLLLRTHRSWLVNADCVDEIIPTDTGGHQVRLGSGKLVPLSRGYRDTFKSHFARSS